MKEENYGQVYSILLYNLCTSLPEDGRVFYLNKANGPVSDSTGSLNVVGPESLIYQMSC